MLESQLPDSLEVLAVLLVRGRIAPLDIVEAEAVEPLAQKELVLERETDPFAWAPSRSVVS